MITVDRMRLTSQTLPEPAEPVAATPITQLEASLAEKDIQLAHKEKAVRSLNRKASQLKETMRRYQKALEERNRRIKSMLPYVAAIRHRHNGYNKLMREQFPDLKEPETPRQAIAELIEEAERMGKKEAEALSLLEKADDVLGLDISYLMERIRNLPADRFPEILGDVIIRKHQQG